MKTKKVHLPGKWTRGTKWVFLCLAWVFAPTVYTQNIAESGSPLYLLTVRESVEGLKNSGNEKPGEAAKVCPQCGKVHAAVLQGQADHAAAALSPGASQPGQPCPICGQIHSTVPATNLTSTATVPSASPIAGRFYYCQKCKVYHQSKPLAPVSSLALPNLSVSVPSITRTNDGSLGRR